MNIKLYTLREVAKLLKVSYRVVWQWVADGELKSADFGSPLRSISRISEKDLNDFLKKKHGKR